jgi:hypothetical protein
MEAGVATDPSVSRLERGRGNDDGGCCSEIDDPLRLAFRAREGETRGGGCWDGMKTPPSRVSSEGGVMAVVCRRCRK